MSLSKLIAIYLDGDDCDGDLVEEVLGDTDLNEDVKIAAVRLGLSLQ